MFWKKPKWSKFPGCFERHLQRRYNNILFPPERRRVSKEEIAQARKRDEMDKERFVKEVLEFEAQIRNSVYVDFLSALQKVQDFLEEAASIGGDIGHVTKILEDLEDKTIKYLNEKKPEGNHLLEKARSHSVLARTPFLAQHKRKDTPILESEEVPTLLSEDLPTISVVGLVSRSFPNFKPSTEDIRKCLDEAILQGFDKEYAQQIINAWNEIPPVQ
ncbi:MAG: hypothetical protein ABSG71_20215 [Thermodesulfobacteriota bacterium]